MKSFAIGVDIGTTQTKAVAFNEGKTVYTAAYVKYPLFQDVRGMAEQSVEEVFQAVVTCLKEVIDKLNSYTISLISFSCAMHSLIAISENNQPLTRIITWADNRAEKYADALKGTSLGHQLYQKTGVPMHAMSPFQKICWLKNEHPEIFYTTKKFVGIKEYVLYRFFGSYVTDISMASGTGFLNIHNLKWEKQALFEMGISEKQLPKLMKPTTQLFNLKKEWREYFNLNEGTPFILGGGDGPLANLGLGAFTKDILTLSIGTSGALRYVTDRPYLHPEGKTFCYVLDEKHWVIGGATSNGAGVFDWACKNLMLDVQIEAKKLHKSHYDAVMNEIDRVPAGAEGLLFHPYLFGERAPLWDSNAVGSFIGLKANHDDKLMMRAIVEGICFNVKQILTELEHLTGTTFEIRATGGFARMGLFKQIMSDILGYSLSFPATHEASALGAVWLGWQNIEQSPKELSVEKFVDKKIDPRMIEKNVYKKNYPIFVSTQQHLAKCYTQLKELVDK